MPSLTSPGRHTVVELWEVLVAERGEENLYEFSMFWNRSVYLHKNYSWLSYRGMDEVDVLGGVMSFTLIKTLLRLIY